MISIFFPEKTLLKMLKVGITEADVYDVFNKGEHGVTPNSKVAIRKYNGYEIGCFYANTNKVSFDYIIISVWKSERR